MAILTRGAPDFGGRLQAAPVKNATDAKDAAARNKSLLFACLLWVLRVLCVLSALLISLPPQEPPLQSGDTGADNDDDHTEDRHAGEDARRVERAFGLRDHVAESARRSQILSHNRAHHRESEAGVEAGEDPREGTRDEDVA